MGVASCRRPRPGSGRDIEPRRRLVASQSGCGRGRSWLCSLLKMAAQPPTGIRLSAVSSREGRSGPGPRRAGRRASQGGGSGRRRLEGMARRPGGRVGAEGPPPCLSARRTGCDVRFVAPGVSRHAAAPARLRRPLFPRRCGRRQLLWEPRPLRPARPGSSRRASSGRRGLRCSAVPARVGPCLPRLRGAESRTLFSPACLACPCLCFGPSPILTNPCEAAGSGHRKNDLHFRVQNIVGVASPDDSRKVLFSGPEVLSGESSSSEDV